MGLKLYVSPSSSFLHVSMAVRSCYLLPFMNRRRNLFRVRSAHSLRPS